MAKKLSGEKTSGMDITIPLFSDICLKIGPGITNGEGYPTSRLQKGLILISNGQELAEEGVGFGVPILKLGVKTIFPGGIELACSEVGARQEITAIFFMNLEERLTSQSLGSVKSRSLYWIKNHLADVYRRFPLARGPLTALSNTLRSKFGWQTTFEDAGCNHAVKVNYTIDSQAGVIAVDVDTTGVPKDGVPKAGVPLNGAPQGGVTEVILMNEQGAHHFDTYSDSSGLLLHGEAIGSWDEVTAERASFLSRVHRLAFNLQQIDGARLFRGRELIGSRLAWSGFGYSLPPTCQSFRYTLGIERLA
ncbi:MAG: hypothetical protein A2Z45_07420 [Chloroflexi bacterium RBG_19FT_COMBO_55_16]|nr:MAG: hypothetical protein A2Z45_07420 [Chloroflexi bacterium RBG_19FT_COMBO_55_16]